MKRRRGTRYGRVERGQGSSPKSRNKKVCGPAAQREGEITMKTMLIVLAGTILMCANATAQALSGTVVGTVTDSQGAAVPAAKVTLINEGTGFSRTVEANQNGQYVAYSFPTGSIKVTVEQNGFQKLVRTGIVLTAADTLAVDLQLQVGNIQETISVNENASALQTESAAVSALLGNRQI